MNRLKCHACDEDVMEAMECAACTHLFHSSCLSDEGEDGALCQDCRQECPECAMPIMLDKADSNHCIADTDGFRCPDYTSPHLYCTHIPQVFDCLTPKESESMRTEIERLTCGQTGVFSVTGLEHIATFIGKRLAPILRYHDPDIETYKFRVRPIEHHGVDLHMDLDYILKHMYDPYKCIACDGTLSQKQSLQQRGLHMSKKCKKVPSVARAFTVAGNFGPEPIAFLAFGPPCDVAKNKSRALIPVVKTGVRMVPCVLEPGQVVFFSSHLLHKSTAEALHANRWSFDARVILP